MEDLILWGSGLVTIVGGIWAFFAKISPLIIMKRSTYRTLLSLRENTQLESVVTPDGRVWVWRRDTNHSNVRKHGISFSEIAESQIEDTHSEGLTPSELKRSYLTLRGKSFYCCIYYEGEGYNRVFSFFPPSSTRDK